MLELEEADKIVGSSDYGEANMPSWPTWTRVEKVLFLACALLMASGLVMVHVG